MNKMNGFKNTDFTITFKLKYDETFCYYLEKI